MSKARRKTVKFAELDIVELVENVSNAETPLFIGEHGTIVFVYSDANTYFERKANYENAKRNT